MMLSFSFLMVSCAEVVIKGNAYKCELAKWKLKANYLVLTKEELGTPPPLRILSPT